MDAAVVMALGLLSAVPELPSHVVLDVGLVRVTPFRPGGKETWDKVTEEKPRPGFCDAAGAIPLPMAQAFSAACGLAKAAGTADAKVEKHPVTDPDVFVRVVAGPGVSYRSHTVPNTLSHVFHFRVVVPTDAIPKSGVEVYVQNDDGIGDEETQENVGALRLTREQLATALGGNGLLRLDDKQGGLERIEIAVSEAEPARSFTQLLDVSKLAAVVDGQHVSAGEVVEVVATGQYRVGETLMTSKGKGGHEGNLQGAPFATAAHGVAWVAVGEHRALERFLVPSCAKTVASLAGLVAVAVNSSTAAGVSGELKFAVNVRPPTVTEWKSRRPDSPCTPVQEYVEGEFVAKPMNQAAAAAFFAEVARNIQLKTHPTGKSPSLANLKMTTEGETMAVRIDVAWKGGVLGTNYRTVVLWEFNIRKHIRAVVESDTALAQVQPDNAAALNWYFANSVHPQFVASMEATARAKAAEQGRHAVGE